MCGRFSGPTVPQRILREAVGGMFENNYGRFRNRLRIKKTVNENGINYARLLDIKSNQKLDPYFILIHTFSHLLIKVLVHEAGYDSSSIRERIYISNDSSPSSTHPESENEGINSKRSISGDLR